MDKKKEPLQQSSDEIFAAAVVSEYLETYGKQVLEDWEETEDFPAELDAQFYALLEQSQAPKRKRRSLRRVISIIAATMACTVLLMLTAQGLGLNIFGTIAKWTKEALHFDERSPASTLAESVGSDPVGENVSGKIKAAFDKAGLPLSMMPKYLPEGYEPEAIYTGQLESLPNVHILFSNDSGEKIRISVEKYSAELSLGQVIVNKDDDNAYEYISNGRRFYIYQNKKAWCSVWSDGTYMISVTAISSETLLLQIIDSIPEVTYD